MDSGNKRCLSCEKAIRGRVDKKFCDDYCRSAYNNRRNSSHNKYVRNINHLLMRNRRILEGLLPASASTIRAFRTQLSFHGFQFNYFTHTYTCKKGKHYFFCYDHGYQELSKEELVIVRKKING